MKRICSICARKGSSEVPNKNIAYINGKPLIAYSIMQAINTNIFDEVVISSDSDEILEISLKWGASMVVKRPSSMAQNNSAKLPAIQHCIKEALKIKGDVFSTIVDLDVTSPLRNINDIISAVNNLEKSESQNLISASPARRSPYFNLIELNKLGYAKLSKKLKQHIVCRQDSPNCYDVNSSIYVWKRKGFFHQKKVLLKKTIIYEMPQDRSIDIDSYFDLKVVKLLMENEK